MWDGLLKTLYGEASGDRAVATATHVWDEEHWADSARNRALAEWVRSHLARAGLVNAEIVTPAADRQGLVGDLALPRVWEPRSATLDVLVGDSLHRLADYRRVPQSVIVGSVATGSAEAGTEVAVVPPSPDAGASQVAADARGKAVVVGVTGAAEFERVAAAAAAAGAAGLIAIAPKGGHDRNVPRYEFPRGIDGLWGFSLSAEDGRYLLGLLDSARSDGPEVRVRAAVSAKSAGGAAESVTAVIPGTDADAPEVLVFAPLYRGGAVDNAGGGAALLEAARALKAAIAAESVPSPRRTIRFLLGAGAPALAAHLIARTGGTGAEGLPIAGLAISRIGRDAAAAPFTFHRTPEPTSTASDIVLQRLLTHGQPTGSRPPATLPFCPEVGLPADPMFGVSFPVLTQAATDPVGGSRDTPEALFPDALRTAATVAAAAALWLSRAGGTEAAWLAEAVYARARGEMNGIAGDTVQSLLGQLSRAEAEGGRSDVRLNRGRREAKRRLTRIAELCCDRLSGLSVWAALKPETPEAGRRGRKESRKTVPEDAVADPFRWITGELASRARRDCDDAIGRINRVVDLEVTRLSVARNTTPAQLGIVADLPVPESLQEHIAAQLIPQRTTPGFLRRTGLPVTEGAPTGDRLLYRELLWADGKRSIRDIHRLLNAGSAEFDLSYLMELFAHLAGQGHVEFSRQGRSESNREDLLADLRRLGVREGAPLVVHSTLRAIGYVMGGAVAVLEALLEAVGPRGTLVMPTFNRPVELFLPEYTPSDIGTLGEFLRHRSDAVRSVHPTHSVAALGPEAVHIVAGHAKASAMGADSPLHRLARKGGYVLLLGVGQDRNTMIHVGETLAGAGYRSLPFSPEFDRPLRSRLPDGTIASFEPTELGGCSENFGVLDASLRAAGRMREGKVGLAGARLMKAEDVLAAVKDLLAKDRAALLCKQPFCGFCFRARAALTERR